MLPWTRLSIDQSSLQGCTGVNLRRSDLQGGAHLVRGHPTEAIRHKEAHPSEINREVIRRTISYVRRALEPNLNVLLHGTRLAGEAKAKANTNTHAAAREDQTPSRQSARGTADI